MSNEIECDERDWHGAEEWMPLAWELCANECGEEACTELVWEGGPIPEPWGDRWLKYEDQAKDMIAMVRKSLWAVAADAAQGGEAVQVPKGLARSDADFWLRHRTAIIEACRAEGFAIVSTAHSVRLMRLGKIEAQITHPAPAPAVPAGYALAPAAKIISWVNGSYSRNYKLEWLDGGAHLDAGAVLYVLSAAPKPEVVAGWQPIETAPKDGTLFLCWVEAVQYGETDEGQQYQIDVSQTDFCQWQSFEEAPDGGWFEPCCGHISDHQRVTHWMPLPAAPEPTHD